MGEKDEPTGIPIENNMFWVLQIEKNDEKKGNTEKQIFAAPQPAYREIKRLVEEGLNTEGINLVSVDCSGDQWKIQQVSWDTIFRGVFQLKE